MYRAIGLLQKGHLVEVDRAELVGQYVGAHRASRRTGSSGAPSTACSSSTRPTRCAAEDGRIDFGPEAVEVLLKRMEDHRHRLVVIVAGYPRLMRSFLDSNPGLRSRFAREICFPDYTNDELVAISEKMAADAEYTARAGPTRRSATFSRTRSVAKASATRASPAPSSSRR